MLRVTASNGMPPSPLSRDTGRAGSFCSQSESEPRDQGHAQRRPIRYIPESDSTTRMAVDGHNSPYCANCQRDGGGHIHRRTEGKDRIA